jgi:hypothetical protein
MAKSQPKKETRQPMPPVPPKTGPARALNTALNRQMRKLLGKHYRAKYGVK